jgi:hypothetical protein
MCRPDISLALFVSRHLKCHSHYLHTSLSSARSATSMMAVGAWQMSLRSFLSTTNNNKLNLRLSSRCSSTRSRWRLRSFTRATVREEVLTSSN